MSVTASYLASLIRKNLQVVAARYCSSTNLVDDRAFIFDEPAQSINRCRCPNDPPQALVETLDGSDAACGLIKLHPEIFGRFPLLHVIARNLQWQKDIRDINYVHHKNRMEMPGSGKKPWPQKGLGKARTASRRAPHWKYGGRAHGLREFTTKYRTLQKDERILGLTSLFSVKFSQDDLAIVDSLHLSSPDPKQLEELVDLKGWGPSVLFSDVSDVFPALITEATDQIPHFTLMPAYGLNVMSMLKHGTLVLTVDAVRHIESKLLQAIYDPDFDRRATEWRKRNRYE